MISRLLWGLFSVMALVLVLSGCTTTSMLTPVVNPTQTWQYYQPHLVQLTAWHLTAETGIVANGQGQTANVDWQQQANGHFTIELYGPLGLGATVLSGMPGQVTLQLHNGKTYQAVNAELLMQQVLGWSLPVEGLVYWIRGLPEPMAPAQIQLNAYGTLASLTQQGWVIDYQQYQAVNGLPLPTKIKLTNGSLRVIIIVRQW